MLLLSYWVPPPSYKWGIIVYVFSQSALREFVRRAAHVCLHEKWEKYSCEDSKVRTLESSSRCAFFPTSTFIRPITAADRYWHKIAVTRNTLSTPINNYISPAYSCLDPAGHVGIAYVTSVMDEWIQWYNHHKRSKNTFIVDWQNYITLETMLKITTKQCILALVAICEADAKRNLKPTL